MDLANLHAHGRGTNDEVCGGTELARVPWSYAEFLFQAKDWKTRVEKFEDRVEKIEEVVGIKQVQHLYYEELQKDLLGTLTKILHGVGARVQVTNRRGSMSQWTKRGSESVKDTLTSTKISASAWRPLMELAAVCRHTSVAPLPRSSNVTQTIALSRII